VKVESGFTEVGGIKVTELDFEAHDSKDEGLIRKGQDGRTFYL
jgi:hypothetical protein